MNRYRIVAADPDSAIVALVDAHGRCHVGRAIGAAPQPGAELAGEPPAVGLRALRLVPVNDPCPVVFALLDCDPEAAVKLASGGLTL